MQQYSEYVNFNQEVYERFFAPNLNSYSNVASILANISEIQDSNFFNGACAFIKDNDWDLLCITHSDGVPLYLGIIAVQVLAAAERKKDELCTPSAYRPRLAELLNIQVKDVSKKFSSYQEQIYDAFEEWCNKNRLAIFLSRKNNNSYRHVQFPLSLALLHKRDLESLSYFFYRCNLCSGDEIDFYSFLKIIHNHIGSLPASIYRKWHKISDPDRKHALCKQIYSAFLEWDGSYEENHKKYKRKRRPPVEYTMYWLGHEQFSPQVFCNDDEMSYYNFIKDFPRGCFFERDYLRHNDWIHISEHRLRVEENSSYAWLVGNTTFINAVKRYLGEPNYNYGDGQFKIFMISAKEIKLLINYFPEYFKNNSQEPFIKLIGGLKIGARKWLAGAGPILLTEGNVGATARLVNLQNNEKKVINIIEQPLINLSSGRYLLQYSSDAPAILFTISSKWEEPACKGGGWHVDNDCIYPTASEDFQLQGLDFSNFPVEPAAEDFLCVGNALHQWMSLAIGHEKNEISNENIVHKALRRKLNGIRNR